MYDRIENLCWQVMDRIDHAVANRGGMDRVNVMEMGELIDMVKDLAEAKEKCRKAEYYEAVTQHMENGGEIPVIERM